VISDVFELEQTPFKFADLLQSTQPNPLLLVISVTLQDTQQNPHFAKTFHSEVTEKSKSNYHLYWWPLKSWNYAFPFLIAFFFNLTLYTKQKYSIFERINEKIKQSLVAPTLFINHEWIIEFISWSLTNQVWNWHILLNNRIHKFWFKAFSTPIRTNPCKLTF